MTQTHLNNPKNNSNSGNSKKTWENLSEAYRQLSPYLNIGYVWAASVLIFTLLGWYLDSRWNTRPWLTLFGALFGIGAGFYNFFKTVSDQEKKQNNSK